MIVENATNAYRLLRARWYLIPMVLGVLVLVEVANDYVRFDRPAFSEREHSIQGVLPLRGLE